MRGSPSISTVMRISLLVAACQVICGCTMMRNSTHVLLTDPLHFPNNLNHATTRHQNRLRARRLLREICTQNPGIPTTKEYESGFVDGFVDYVTYGARAAPPTLPPARFWKKKYATPEGHAAARDWHVGFEDGTRAAASSGLREFQLVPSSLRALTYVPLMEQAMPGDGVLPEYVVPLHSAPGETRQESFDSSQRDGATHEPIPPETPLNESPVGEPSPSDKPLIDGPSGAQLSTPSREAVTRTSKLPRRNASVVERRSWHTGTPRIETPQVLSVSAESTTGLNSKPKLKASRQPESTRKETIQALRASIR